MIVVKNQSIFGIYDTKNFITSRWKLNSLDLNEKEEIVNDSKLLYLSIRQQKVTTDFLLRIN